MSTSQKEEYSKRKYETDEQRSNKYQHIKFSLLPLCFVFVKQLIVGLSAVRVYTQFMILSGISNPKLLSALRYHIQAYF
jgi:hypothetical protein